MYEGKKVRLRAVKVEEAKVAQEWVNDYEVRKTLQDTTAYPFTMGDQNKFYEGISGMKDTYTFGIETLEGVYIGNCGVNEVDWKNSKVELGILIGNKEYWSRGYGTDAVNVLLKFIFEEMNINRVYLNVFGNNPRAIACYKKCGFVEEGIMREGLFRSGRYYDEVLMGILRREWEAKVKG